MPEELPRVIKKSEYLYWSMIGYIERYVPWAEGDVHSETPRDYYGYEIGSVDGHVQIDYGDVKKILEAYIEGGGVFSMPVEKIGRVGGNFEIGGKKYIWYLAKAIASYFKNGRHLNFMDHYDHAGVIVEDDLG